MTEYDVSQFLKTGNPLVFSICVQTFNRCSHAILAEQVLFDGSQRVFFDSCELDFSELTSLFLAAC